jgi:hypothetical protein
MIRGYVLGIEPDGTFAVAYGDGTALIVRCDLLRASAGKPLELAKGDAVVALLPDEEERRGVILGRLGRTNASGAGEAETPDELVIEAKKGLILKCGEGSITFRAGGKILIKGKDLVSHAKGMNRIKGGAVSIN